MKLLSTREGKIYKRKQEGFNIMKEEWIVELAETDCDIWCSDIDCNSRE